MGKFLNDVKTKMQIVRNLLIKHSSLRDSDKLLWLAYMVTNEDLKNKIGNKAYNELRKILMNPTTPTFETLSRCRRKIQSKEVDLRGVNYKDRKEHAKEVKDNINK